jgi:hypothetical protein
MGLMRPLATNSYSANRLAWNTIARSGYRRKADIGTSANDPNQTSRILFGVSWLARGLISGFCKGCFTSASAWSGV